MHFLLVLCQTKRRLQLAGKAMMSWAQKICREGDPASSTPTLREARHRHWNKRPCSRSNHPPESLLALKLSSKQTPISLLLLPWLLSHLLQTP